MAGLMVTVEAAAAPLLHDRDVMDIAWHVSAIGRLVQEADESFHD